MICFAIFDYLVDFVSRYGKIFRSSIIAGYIMNIMSSV